MKNYILASAFFLAACGQTKPKADDEQINLQTNAPANVSEQSKPTQKLSRLDSIEKANNASVMASGDHITRASVFLKGGDSTIHLTSNIRQDHRIFGYAQPDVRSERLLLLSVFTDDVENNPFGCKFGSYYDTSGMDKLTLKYLSTNNNFVKAAITDQNNQTSMIYFEKKWIELL